MAEEVLLAPITEADYRTYPVMQLPPDFTGEKFIRLLNDTWAWIEQRVNQPLKARALTHVYPLGTRYANVDVDGILVVAMKYLPVVSITTVKWTSSTPASWTACTSYDLMDDHVRVYDSPFVKGDRGMVQLAYTAGYSTIPYDLRMACVLMASHKASGSVFPTQAGSSILPVWMPKEVLETIDRYKRVR